MPPIATSLFSEILFVAFSTDCEQLYLTGWPPYNNSEDRTGTHIRHGHVIFSQILLINSAGSVNLSSYAGKSDVRIAFFPSNANEIRYIHQSTSPIGTGKKYVDNKFEFTLFIIQCLWSAGSQ